MKATQRDFARGMRQYADSCRLYFFCGPDEAGAAAAMNKLIAALPDAGEREELSGGSLKSDPSRLVDEARSTSLFGSTRHIVVRVTGDEAHDAVQAFIELADRGETDGACPVFIHAMSATDKARTAKLLEKRKDALVAMFWPPNFADVVRDVRGMADAAGLRLSGDLAERIARGAGLDVRLAQSEVEKLALYLDASPASPKMAEAGDLDAIGASTEEDGFAPLVDAVMRGDLRKLPGELQRMREVGLNPVGVALALERRAAQLAALTARLQPGQDPANLVESEAKARRVFFGDKRALIEQLQRWPGNKLERLVPRLAELHRTLLTNSQAAELLLSQSLAMIARVAAARR